MPGNARQSLIFGHRSGTKPLYASCFPSISTVAPALPSMRERRNSFGTTLRRNSAASAARWRDRCESCGDPCSRSAQQFCNPISPQIRLQALAHRAANAPKAASSMGGISNSFAAEKVLKFRIGSGVPEATQICKIPARSATGRSSRGHTLSLWKPRQSWLSAI